MVGRVTPGFEINDNPATTGRSIGYGAPSTAYGCGESPVQYFGADQSIWTQTGPETLKLQPTIPATSRAVPDFSQGKMLAYGADLPPMVTQYYPGFLKNEISLPVFGTVMVGTVTIAAVVTFFVVRYVRKKKNAKVIEEDEELYGAKRYRHKGGHGGKSYYMERKGYPKSERGQFKRGANINRSIRADMRRDAIARVKPNYGHMGDREYYGTTEFEGRMEGQGDSGLEGPDFVAYAAGKGKKKSKRKVTHGSRRGEPVALGRERRWRNRSAGGKGKYMYVDRDRHGQYKDWVSIPRSIRADMARDAETITRPKFGNKGDLPFSHVKGDALADLEQGTDPSYVATKFGLSPSEMRRLGYGDYPIVDVVNRHMLYGSE